MGQPTQVTNVSARKSLSRAQLPAWQSLCNGLDGAATETFLRKRQTESERQAKGDIE